MALSEKKHHTSRGYRKDRAMRSAEFRDNPSSSSCLRKSPAGSRPPCLGEPRRPQERVQQRTLDQLADVVPVVRILDIPGRQERDQVVEVCCGSSTCRLSSRLSQCPRNRCHPALHVRFLVSRRRRNSWWKGQLSCLSSMSSSRPLTFQFALVVVLAMEVSKFFSQDRVLLRLPSRPLTSIFFRGLQGLHPGQSSTAVSEQNVDIPDSRGGFQGFHPDQGSAAIFPDPRGHAFLLTLLVLRVKFFTVFFALIPTVEKCESPPRVGTGCAPQLIHAGSSAAVHATSLGKALLGGL